MNAKKLLALLLALVLCLSTLAACNSDPKETTQATTKATEGTTQATTQATETTTSPVGETAHSNLDKYPIDFDGTLTAATTRSTAAETHNYLLMEELTGVDIDWKVMSSEQTPLLFVGSAANELPDIFFGAGGVSVSQMKEFGQAGMLVNFLDPEILDKMPNLKAHYEADPHYFDGVLDPNGAAYTLPNYSYTLTIASNLFYVRLDQAREAGWETLPATIEEFLTFCEDLKTAYANVEGYVPMTCNGAVSISWNGAYSTFFFPAFGEYLTPNFGITPDNSTVYAGFATDQFKYYLEFMQKLYTKGYMDPDCFVNESATTKAMTNEGLTSMHPHATQLSPDNFASGTLDFQVMPPLTSEYQSTPQWLIPNRYRSTTYAISANTKYLDEACAFLDACYAPMNNPLKDEDGVKAWGISLWLGELGEDFTMDEETGTYEILPHEGIENASTFLATAGHGSSLHIEWPYVENSGTGLMIKALGSRDILEPQGVKAMDISLLILNQDELDTYNDCWTDIANKIAEMNAAFITGQADLEKDWDAYINDLYAMGLQDLIDNYQAALDRYNAG